MQWNPPGPDPPGCGVSAAAKIQHDSISVMRSPVGTTMATGLDSLKTFEWPGAGLTGSLLAAAYRNVLSHSLIQRDVDLNFTSLHVYLYLPVRYLNNHRRLAVAGKSKITSFITSTRYKPLPHGHPPGHGAFFSAQRLKPATTLKIVGQPVYGLVQVLH